jgi:extracellular factor (EF) 3-hydroxypalmitic acid methyl ester biosynthesis protein
MCLEQTLAPVELKLQSLTGAERTATGDALVSGLLKKVRPDIDALVGRFEAIASKIPAQLESIHSDYIRGILHPFLLSSPIIHRSYSKPLGVPGDFGILKMLLGNPYLGLTLFDKALNGWLIGTAAGDAYRHRMRLMVQSLGECARSAHQQGRAAHMLSLGCGAGREVQEFFREDNIAFNSNFTLVDFDKRTLEAAATQIGVSRMANRCLAPVRLVRQSVNEFINASRTSGRARNPESTSHLRPGQYDLVYCMGLFDYFSDRVCRRLLRIFYQIAAPGGRIMVCNFAPANPIRYFMSYLLDWELKHRDKKDMLDLVPKEIPEGSFHITTSDDRVECYLHICKPDA